MQKHAPTRVGDRLLVQVVAEMAKQGIKPRRVDDGPRNDFNAASVKSRYKVLILLFLYNPLELEGKPMREDIRQRKKKS